MEKNKTAVEWLFEQMFNSFEKFNNGEYTFDEYLKRNLEIRKEAKEMEKDQLINAVSAGWDYNEEGYVRWMGEQYYNDTYKSPE